MAAIKPYLANLNGGLLSPLLAGRVDLAKYQNCLSVGTNVIPLVQGGVMKRWGTRYRGTVENAPPYTLTLSALGAGAGITATTSAAYWIASDVGRVITAGTGVGTITAINTDVQAVITITADFAASPIAAGDWTITPRKARMFPFLFSADDAHIIECNADVLRFWKYTAGVPALCASGATIVRVSGTGLTEAYLPSVQYAQSADVVILAHPSLAPREIKRMAADGSDWLGGAFAPAIPATYQGGHYPAKAATLSAATVGTGRTLTINDATTIFLTSDIGRFVSYRGGRAIITALGGASPHAVATVNILAAFPAVGLPSGAWQIEGSPVCSLSAPAGWATYIPPMGQTFTVTASNITGATGQDAFRAEDAGKYLVARDGMYYIQTYTNAQQVSALCVRPQSEAADAANRIANFGVWTLQTPAWTSARGYPKAATFHEQRAVFAGTSAQRNTIWGSPIGEPNSLAVGTRDDDGFALSPMSGQVPTIEWLASGRKLSVGTTSDPLALSGTSDGGITPTSFDVKPSESNVGSENVQPARIGGSTLFVQRGGRALRAYYYDYTVDRYVVTDISVEASPVRVDGQIVELSACDYPGPLDAASVGVGNQPVVWALVNDAAGTLLSTTYDPTNKVNGWAAHTLADSGIVESVATIPHPTRGHDETWLIVRRTVGGRTVRYVEVMEQGATMDCSVAGTMAPGTSISGLAHLNGKTVGILARRSSDAVWRIYPDATVTAGAVTVSEPVDAYEVGLRFTWTAATVALQPAGAQNIQGDTKRWKSCRVRTYATRTLLVNGVRTPVGYAAGAAWTLPAVFTDDVDVPTVGWTEAAIVTLSDSLPLPATVLSIYGQVEVGG